MELTIGTLIKIIIGILVFVVVVIGVYLFFKEYVIDFFTGGNASSGGAILAFLK